MQKNKEQVYYQGTETCRFGFEVRNKVKEPESKFLLNHGNLPFVLVFDAINKAR